MKELKLTNELKEKLLSLSMSFVSDKAYDFAEKVYEGDYFYLVSFKEQYTSKSLGKYTLLSKYDKSLMKLGIFTKTCEQFIEFRNEMVEILDGYYIFRQYESDGDFAFEKYSYWVKKRRDSKIEKILTK